MSPRNSFLNYTIPLLVIATIIITTYVWICQVVPMKGDTDTMLKQYSSAQYNLSFFYPYRYILDEKDVPQSVLEQHAIVLVDKKDLPQPKDAEGPPSITIDIYQNSQHHQTAEEWIRNSKFSNFDLGDKIIRRTTMNGLPALSYRWSGLYEGTTIVVAQTNLIYVFSVTYFEIGAPIVQDFVSVTESAHISN